MEIDVEKQKKALLKTQKLLQQEEQKRQAKRIHKLVADLEAGNNEVLSNDGFMEKLPSLLVDYCKKDTCDKAVKLFEKLGQCVASDSKKIRERALMALSLCLAQLSDQQQPDLTKMVSQILLTWLQTETEYLSVCTSICKQIQEYGVQLLQEGMLQECYPLLEVFSRIQSGDLEKTNAIRSVVCRAQDAMAVEYILEELTLVILHGRGKRREQAELILTNLGNKATIHLLDKLLACNEREDRLRLVGIIPATGNVTVAVLQEYLQKKLPWYGIRNILLIITAIDDPELVPLIMPFLSHEDLRIQQQVLDCITEIVEDNLSEYLVKALPVVDDSLKVELVSYLGQLGDSNAIEAFLDLLGKRDSFSLEVRDDLLRKLAIQIRLSDSQRAINLLKMIEEERRETANIKTDPVLRTVMQSLQVLEERQKSCVVTTLEEDSQNPEQGMLPNEDISFDNDPEGKTAAYQKVHFINIQVGELLGKGKTSEASKLLYDRCLLAAEEKDFITAEILRDRILEVDPNALSDIISAGEIIEERRSSSIASSHVSIWQELYDSLTTEEFNALYYSLEARDYATGAIVVEEGEDIPVLFFVNSGQVGMTCKPDQEEIFLKRVGPGEIIGCGPFFDVSVWTVTLTALSRANIHILDREKFIELLASFPALEPCLANYCQKTDNVPQLLSMSNEDRRRAVRYPYTRIVKHTLLDKYGTVIMRSFKGEIIDISTSGLSFSIRISKKENARLMLDRGIKTVLPVSGGKTYETTGKIVAVRYKQQEETDYSVHVKFTEAIAEDMLKRILQ